MIMRKGAAVVLATLALAACAAAQGTRGERGACREDYKKFCAAVSPGGGRVKQCLADNIDKLTEACKASMASAPGKP